jgi:elongation factor Tu
MGTPTGASQPARYTVVPLLGPDGVGKTSLLQALGAYVQRRDGLYVPPLRAVQNATVLDVRTARGVFQHVDFASAAAEDALLGSSPFQGAVLVVSAADGVMPGTVRSLAHAREVGIPRVAVALTHCDTAADPELIDLVTMELRELLSKHEYAGERDDAPVGCVAVFPTVREDELWMMKLAQFFDAVQAWIQ